MICWRRGFIVRVNVPDSTLNGEVMTWQEQNNISSTSGQAEAAQPIAQ
jgi:hypothetical protein